MEKKKNDSVNYDKQHYLFLCIGFCLSAVIVYSAFQIQTKYSPITFPDPEDPFTNYIPTIPITEFERKEQPVIPPKQKLKPVVIVDEPVDKLIQEVIKETITPMEPTDPAGWIDNIEDTVASAVKTPFLVLEKMASFPGGDKAWGKFLRKNFKYPRQAKRMGIEGKVLLSFYVDAQGSVSDIKVVRSIGGGCDEEAIRVLKASPRWNPGEQRGKPVKSPMSLFIHFVLK